MTQIFADTLYWVASIMPGDPWYAPALRAVATLGSVDLVTTEEVLMEFLSAYAGRGACLRQEALKTVQAILGNVHVIVLPQTHESLWIQMWSSVSHWDFDELSIVPPAGELPPFPGIHKETRAIELCACDSPLEFRR